VRVHVPENDVSTLVVVDSMNTKACEGKEEVKRSIRITKNVKTSKTAAAAGAVENI
jgi:hypothetical protein